MKALLILCVLVCVSARAQIALIVLTHEDSLMLADSLRPLGAIMEPRDSQYVLGETMISVVGHSKFGLRRARVLVDGRRLYDFTYQPTLSDFDWGLSWYTPLDWNGPHLIVYTIWDSLGRSRSDSQAVFVRNPIGLPAAPSHTVSAIVIYADSLAPGWKDTCYPASSLIVRDNGRIWAGKYAMKCTVMPDTGIIRFIRPIGISTASFSHLEFRILVDSADVPIRVAINRNYNTLPVEITDIPKGFWSFVQIPIDAFGWRTLPVTIIDFRQKAKGPRRFWIDNLRFTK